MMQGLLLAAGYSRRFGADKLLHPLPDGTPVGLAAARNLIAALPGALAVVNDADGPLAGLLREAGLGVSACPHAQAGMGASLAWGVAQTPDAGGWLVALADMPFILPQTIRRVASAIDRPNVIAAPVHRGRRGHPVAFGPAHRQELTRLDGDRGARVLLERHAQSLVRVDCDDPGVLRDIDTLTDLA